MSEFVSLLYAFGLLAVILVCSALILALGTAIVWFIERLWWKP